MHQGLEDVPALFSGGGDDGTHSGEVVGLADDLLHGLTERSRQPPGGPPGATSEMRPQALEFD